MMSAMKENEVWMLIRSLNGKAGQDQTIPGWNGFVSSTGIRPTNLTTIDYYPVINHPITDYETVQECLRYSEAASQEVGQKYVITTFDLGVCMKAYPLLFSNPTRYKNHIVMIGTFHAICAYLKMVGKKMYGSGISDVLLEADLIASGSIHGVLPGKNYDRAMNCYKVMLESLERLVFDQFLLQRGETKAFQTCTGQSAQMVKDLDERPSKEALDAVLNDHLLQEYVNDFFKWQTSSSVLVVRIMHITLHSTQYS